MEVQTVTATTANPNIEGKYMKEGHVVIECDAEGGDFQLDLPRSPSVKDVVFILKGKGSSGVTTIKPVSGETIDDYA